MWLTTEEASRELRIPVSTVRRKIREGKLPVSPHGKPYRINSKLLKEGSYEGREVAECERTPEV